MTVVRNIVLMGFMGAGKTYWGQKIASYLNWGFCDLDDLIEQQQRMSVPLIFEKFGETFFRELEQKNLGNLLNKSKLVVALGGGTPCNQHSIKRIISSAGTCCIYLKLSPEILYERLHKETAQRPLLANKTAVQLQYLINERLNERAKFYEQAQYSLTIEHQNLKNFAAIIKEHNTDE